jgi:hypothetical protein
METPESQLPVQKIGWLTQKRRNQELFFSLFQNILINS